MPAAQTIPSWARTSAATAAAAVGLTRKGAAGAPASMRDQATAAAYETRGGGAWTRGEAAAPPGSAWTRGEAAASQGAVRAHGAAVAGHTLQYPAGGGGKAPQTVL